MSAITKRNYKGNQQQKPTYSVYMPSMISTKIHLKMNEVGDSTKMNLERKIVKRTEGKCIPEGFVRPDSVELVTYSSGMVKMNMIEFQVVYKCLICNPVEGHELECTTKTITKAGIHAEVVTDNKFIPMKIFIARDHNYSNRDFGNIKDNDVINVRIIGKRFELNDPYIVAIAMLVEKREYGQKPAQKSIKQRITVLEDTALNMQDETEYIEPYELENDSEMQAQISIPTAKVSSLTEEGEEPNTSPEEGEIEE
jgi:DNA-directed RNA polymerase subunit E'/Rpb7